MICNKNLMEETEIVGQISYCFFSIVNGVLVSSDLCGKKD